MRRIRARITDQRGFTLIEVLVVASIIPILAGIAIPSFLGQREKAKDPEAKSAVRNAASAIELFHAETGDLRRRSQCDAGGRSSRHWTRSTTRT